MTDVKELMAKVGKIRILTNKLIDDQLSGDYHSTFKGQGVEFDEASLTLSTDVCSGYEVERTSTD